MSLVNAILGTASRIDSEKLKKEFEPILVPGEVITAAYKVVRDLFVFTQHRLILVDKQGVTGRKTEYHSIPYKAISQFAVETSGHFDMDSELKIYISSNPTPIKREFKRGTDIVAVQKLLAAHVFA
jgi:hypothetical protein